MVEGGTIKFSVKSKKKSANLKYYSEWTTGHEKLGLILTDRRS